ncbi:KRFA protein, partial [Nothoprocta pentlandii]|nr:KRFA protein [Nothoprocta pentlandii]
YTCCTCVSICWNTVNIAPRSAPRRQCEDSCVVIQHSTVVVALPGPILSSFPQSTAVGSSSSAAVGDNLRAQGVPIHSGAFGFGYGAGFGGLGC